jgi:hypothetical protein
LEGLLSALFTRISLLPTRDTAREASEGAVLARHEGDFRGEAQEQLSLQQLLALLGDAHGCDDRTREHAIACYLSGGDGWREAVKLLGGTFAEGNRGLKEVKPD